MEGGGFFVSRRPSGITDIFAARSSFANKTERH